MAAYASLVSLTHLVEQIQHHPDPPLSLDPKQAKSLTEKISFLQCFLEDFHSRGIINKEIHDLESRIADAAHAAEDLIETHGVHRVLLASGYTTEDVTVYDDDPRSATNEIETDSRSIKEDERVPSGVDQILLASRSTTEDVTESESSIDLYEGLQRVIQEMEFIEKEVINTKNKSRKVEDDRVSQRPMLPFVSPRIANATTMVGFDDILIQVMERLTGNESRRDIVSLIGMGGAGKTTLARSIYEEQLIVDHFHVRSWATISQECVVRQVLIEILLCQKAPKSREALSQESEENLGDQLYKSLCGRKYLIVMDDLWSIEAWDKLRFFFPDNNNGSRIMITTRLSKLAFLLSGSRVIKMDPLDEDTSWDLLCKKVFAGKSCPLELGGIGRTIARNCRGLPLSIVTVGGILARANMTSDYWGYVAENLSPLVNSEDDEHCLRILSLSYIHLPVHLKPCFLYMGLFPEDARIYASYLIKLWVAEGFLKPIRGKTLQEAGEDYLKDLVDRNVVLVHRWGSTGKIKLCVVHDLLRDLCIREVQKEKFYTIERIHNLRDNGINNTHRRIAIRKRTFKWEDPPHHGTIYSASTLRSCLIDYECKLKLTSLRSVRLLRILVGVQRYTYCNLNDIVPLVNSRFLSLTTNFSRRSNISFIWSMSWNLQILMYNGYLADYEIDIWKMPQLRHVMFKEHKIYLSDPPPSSNVDKGQLLVLENLLTLSTVMNFKCSEEVVKRIPNIKKLSIYYDEYEVERKSMDYGDFGLDNLWRLQNLESFKIRIFPQGSRSNWLDDLTLPYYLKKLTLDSMSIHWDNNMSTTIGSLPLLEVLKLRQVTFVGGEWNLFEGKFCLLKYLELYWCHNLKYWNADNRHFPRLECIQIYEIRESSFKEFPSGIGDIPTLRLIVLRVVGNLSLIVSAKRMMEEQDELGNVELRVEAFVLPWGGKELTESMASRNFKIIY